MPRRKVAFLPGYYYHLYNRGNNRQNIFFERENYLFFLRQFRQHVMGTADVLAYCLMPNHYHFLVCLKEENLSEKMGLFSLSYTKAINKRIQRSGALFQGPFQSIHVDKDAYLLNLTRYIHLNSVKAGLVERPADWEFSSYPEYVEQRQGSLPQYQSLQQEAGGASAYQRFVETETALVSTALQKLMLDE
jgi:REP element-mobilizing transposase RayT